MSPDDYIDFDPPDLRDVLWTVEGEQPGESRFTDQRRSKYGHVKVVVAPNQGVQCFRFIWRPEPGSLPEGFMRSAALDGVKHAVLETKFKDLQIAFVQVTVVDGSYHDVDTDEMAVMTATSMAVQDALSRAKLVRI